MIDFYTWTTPNGYKISIMLEECGLDYAAHPVNIGAGEQFRPDFLKVSPNNKIPAIVDHDAEGGPVSIFESGAILVHLAERTGQFLPKAPAARAETMKWLFWQVGGFGPILGQFYHFTSEDRQGTSPYAYQRYRDESVRLFDVLEAQLSGRDFVAGDYSIADMAIHPWAETVIDRLSRHVGKDWPDIRQWLAHVAERPAVGRGYQVPAV